MTDFEVIYLFLTFCLVVVGILNLTHKNSRPDLAQTVNDYFLVK